MRSAEPLDPTSPRAAAAEADLPLDRGPATPSRVVILNHQQDELHDAVAALRRAGHDATEARSLAESHRSLERGVPDLAILNPLIFKAGGVELALVEQLQHEDRPVPVILLVEALSDLDQARRMAVPIRDFLLKPAAAAELVHRVELALRARDGILQLHRRTRELEGQIINDFKTGLLSDRHFRQVLQIEFKRAQRHHTPLSLLMIDVDDFKSINDTTNYEFGDIVLRHVAQVLRHGIRETDFAARFGGDEFLLLLPHTTPAEAVQTAMRIRKKIGQHVVQSRGFSRTVTLSIGIDTYDGRVESNPQDLQTRANKALHQAKRRGKNQVSLHEEESAPPRTAPPRAVAEE